MDKKEYIVELFYSENIDGNIIRLDEEESGHCVRVLRHRAGDEIDIIDGKGTLLHCRIVSDHPKAVEVEVLSRDVNWHNHPYCLTMAVCPTKNIDRYEWFVEKATELGVDVVVPVIGEHSERRVVKTQRLEKIVLSAAKQSLKGAIPAIAEPVTVKDFICSENPDSIKLIACCFEDAGHPRRSVKEALADWLSENFSASADGEPEVYEKNAMHKGLTADAHIPEIVILIGPEGDFSSEELRLALGHGYIPVHLGPSRLRTETAALLCVEEVYSALAV